MTGSSADANLALVHRIFERWSTADYSDVSWADPEIEFVGDGRGPLGGAVPAARVHRGIAEMAHAFSEWLDAFEDFGVEPLSFDASGGAVFTEVRFQGRGKASGMPLDPLRGANVFLIRDHLVVRLELHLDLALARRRFAELAQAG